MSSTAKNDIVELLRHKEQCYANEIYDLSGHSYQAIRRALKELRSAGIVKRLISLEDTRKRVYKLNNQ